MIIYSSVFDLLQPLDYNGQTKEKIIEILPGKNTSQIARLLKHEKLIKNEKVLIIYAKIKGLDSKLKAGKYILHPAMSIPEIVKDLSEGNVLNESIRFTIPEGLELKEIAQLLEKKGLVDSKYFIEIAKVENFPFDFLKGLPGDTTLEGYLFPDTYEVNKDIGEKGIIKIMLKRFENIFNADFVSRARELRLSVHEVITLASIIEREAKVDDERPLISSVFHNRLKIGKLLQSCATVQYALGERKETLLFKDLEIDSPYNTYKVPGLPPGPISNPGKASIKAALFPAETDYLYFVSNGDGTHTFSRTYGEHLRTINRNN
ncbi:MAG: endolytic transglycosylase MltG [Firmicutes bacterium]|nr:endolytic transglycosylase MltG [Bacillota bacterium]